MNDFQIEILGGNQLQDINHLITGFWSLDQALSCGIPRLPGGPLNTMWEVFGYQGVGKSSLVQMLATKAAAGRTVYIADLEPLDHSLMRQIMTSAGHTGKVVLIRKDTHEDTLEEVLLRIKDESAGAVVIDSIGALQPQVIVVNDVEDANVGSQAKMTNKLARTSLLHLRNRVNPILVLATNHVHQIIGGRGTVTSGGVVLGYATRIRIFLSSGEHFDDGSYVVTGRVDKNSFGLENGRFRMVFLSDYGFHPGLSAWQDCEMVGLAKRDRVIKMGDTSFGFASRLIERAKSGDQGIFEQFTDALKEYHV